MSGLGLGPVPYGHPETARLVGGRGVFLSCLHGDSSRCFAGTLPG